MKRSLSILTGLTLAVLGSNVHAADQLNAVDVYGTVHTSVDRNKLDGDTSIDVNSSSRRGWALGARGGMSAAGNLIAIYRFEIGYDGSKDATVGGPGSFYLRDSWAGVKGSFGKVRMGTMATFYKSTGKMVDPLFTTALEGRGGLLATMSGMHAGNGIGAGRGSDMIAYDTPTLGGIFRMNVHLQPRDGDEWNYGGGAKLQVGPATLFGALTTDATGETAMKGGAKAVFGPAILGVQYERGSALNDKQYGHFSVAFKLTRDMDIAMNTGMEIENSDISLGGALKYKLARKSIAYLGYGRNLPGSDSAMIDYSVMTFGLKHGF